MTIMPRKQLGTNRIRRLHIVFKTHLDIGFTDFARNVVALYMDDYLPRALTLAEATRVRGRADRFVWTVGSWLIWEFLEQKTGEARRKMERAIEHGDIAWHALPFTMHSELTDASLFRHGLSLSRRLDERFGKKTIAAKQTDIPGHTRAIVPLLAEAGVKLLHIGVNPASALPRVPPVFRWRSPDGAEVIVIYSGDYGETTTIPVLDEGLSICFTGDNLGPQSSEEVDAVFDQLRAQHPDAQAVGSTLDAFAEKLDSIRSTLPVIESEIGDTWIHGAGTDPWKVATFRELMRLRRHWVAQGHSPLEPNLDRFSQKLLLVAEHTWGLDIKKCLGTEPGESRPYDRDFEPEIFRGKRHLAEYRRLESSWAEQRDYLKQAVDSLPDSPEASQARTMVETHVTTPPVHEEQNWRQLTPGQPVSNTQYEIGFDPVTGAIDHLVHKPTGDRLANASHQLAQFRYNLYSHSCYEKLWKNYIRNKRTVRWWAEQDFTKPGLDRVLRDPRHWIPPAHDIAYHHEEDDRLTCKVEWRPPGGAVHFGCPRRLVLLVSASAKEPRLVFDFSWYEKQANRIPEVMWLSFTFPDIKTVRLRKLARWIDPRDVTFNGGRRLHAIDDRIRFVRTPRPTVELETLDAPLVAAGDPHLVRFTNRPPTLKNGAWFNLYNNAWGTNFPMWYEENGRCRFSLHLST